MRIIFDFDNTLFHEEPFFRTVQRNFRAHGISEELFLQTAAEAYEGNVWRQFLHLNILAKRCDIPFSQLERALSVVISNAHAFLYPDVRLFLEHAHPNHAFSILTFGDERFQRMKIEGAGISRFFQDIIVTQNVMKDTEADMLSKGETALFVEDNPVALEAVKMRAPHIITVRARRGHGKYINEPSGAGIDYEIKELVELTHII